MITPPSGLTSQTCKDYNIDTVYTCFIQLCRIFFAPPKNENKITPEAAHLRSSNKPNNQPNKQTSKQTKQTTNQTNNQPNKANKQAPGSFQVKWLVTTTSTEVVGHWISWEELEHIVTLPLKGGRVIVADCLWVIISPWRLHTRPWEQIHHIPPKVGTTLESMIGSFLPVWFTRG